MTAGGRSATETALVGVGILGLVGAAVMAVSPETLPEPALEALLEVVDAVGGERIAAAFAAAIALLAAGYFRGGGSSEPGLETLVESPPEEASRSVDVVGRGFDERVERTVERIEDGRGPPPGEPPESELEDALIAVLQRTEDCSRIRAESLVDAGAWTDDRLAAAFLGGEDAPDFPLRFRIVRWLRPDLAYERALVRAASEVAANAADENPQIGGGPR